MTNRTVALAGGTQLPAIGLGTWPMDDAEARRVIPQAIELGYRHLDTAENYENERGVGQGIADSGIARDEIWVTTKFNKKWHGDPAGGLEGSLARLGLDHVDLLLIHWPNPDQDRYVEAWEKMLELRERGVARAVGTSNFTVEHLQRLIDATGVAPEVNQVECHPYLDRSAERAFHGLHGIVTECWSPLDRGKELLSEPLVAELAERHGVTPGQVVLAWAVQQGLVPIPKSSDPERLKQNLDVFDVGLTEADLAALTALDAPTGREFLDPLTFGH